jgi:hypothetical protein
MKLLRRARRHTHICASCFGLWRYIPTRGRPTTRGKLVLNREALEELLAKPRDRRKFERHLGTWYHADCWSWLKRFEEQMRKLDRKYRSAPGA